MAIKIKKGNVGKFTAYKKRTGNTTSQALHSKNAHVRKMANFARNAKKWKHEDGGLVQYELGGTLSSLGSVASTIPTPWTQIGGAALSMIGGIVAGNEQKKAAAEQLRQQSVQQAGLAQANVINPFTPTFANGGVIPGMMPNVEVEGGEVLQGTDGTLASVKGPKHSKGGVDLFMENGGRVFSDKIINPETGRTFAEDAERLMKQTK
jgi:hypothetical protein